jgi:hypothetical protein
LSKFFRAGAKKPRLFVETAYFVAGAAGVAAINVVSAENGVT